MHQELGPRRLRNNETVAAALITGPDLDWAARIEAMLGHKGDPWNWQNSELLRQSTGLDARFFILHRRSVPFSNIMVIEHAGVALLGHVWTAETDRSLGASSVLMELAIDDFRQRGGRALFLGTEFDSAPWHYYRRRGFSPVTEGSGYMSLYSEGLAAFETAWFSAAETIIEPLDWPHWPASAPLFLGAEGGAVRIAATQLFGRASSEGPLLPLLREQHRRRAMQRSPSAFVLRGDNAAVLGLACIQPDPLWPETGILDVFCHSSQWRQAPALLERLGATDFARLTSYVDREQPEKHRVLMDAGFRPISTLPEWVAAPLPDRSLLDVALLVRES